MGVHNALPYRRHINMRLPLPSLVSARSKFCQPILFYPPTRSALAMLFQLVLPLLVMADTESSSDSASSRQSDGYGAPYAPPQQYQPRPSYDSYSAPSYQAPTYQALSE